MTIPELESLLTIRTNQIDDLTHWREQLENWRDQLCTELLSDRFKMPLRDSFLLGLKRNLELSIRTIDRGTGVAEGTGYELTNLRLGELMRESGYTVVGADPVAHYAGQMPWKGSLKEIDHWLKDLTAHRDVVQAQLADARLTPAERATRDAAAAQHRAHLNALPVRKTRGDGSQYDRYPDGRRVEVVESS